MLTMADKVGREGQDPPIFADIICEQPLATYLISYMANVIVLPSTNTWVTETYTNYASRSHIAHSTPTVCYFVKLLQEHSSALAKLAVTLFKVAAKTVFAATVATS